jgi:hypothetical protein
LYVQLLVRLMVLLSGVSYTHIHGQNVPGHRGLVRLQMRDEAIQSRGPARPNGFCAARASVWRSLGGWCVAVMPLMAPRSAPLSIYPGRTRRWRNARCYSQNANYISHGMHRNTQNIQNSAEITSSGRADNGETCWKLKASGRRRRRALRAATASNKGERGESELGKNQLPGRLAPRSIEHVFYSPWSRSSARSLCCLPLPALTPLPLPPFFLHSFIMK